MATVNFSVPDEVKMEFEILHFVPRYCSPQREQ